MNAHELVKTFVEISTQTNKQSLTLQTEVPEVLSLARPPRRDAETQTNNSLTVSNPDRVLVSFKIRGAAFENHEIAHLLKADQSLIWCEVALESRRMLAAGRTHATLLDEQDVVNWNDTVELNCAFTEARQMKVSYKIWTTDIYKTPLLLAESRRKLETKMLDASLHMEPSTVLLILGPIRATLIAK